MRMLFVLSWLLVGLSASAAPTKAPSVFAENISPKEIFDTLSYPARLIPTINASLLSEADGIVQKILSPLGKSVKRGEGILVVRNTDPVYQYAPMRVTTPVAGVVSSIDVTEGSRVTKGQKLGAVTDPKKIKIVVEVASADMNDIRPGLLGELSIHTSSDPVPVKVMGMSPFVDPATGTATAELSLVDVDKAPMLPPGLVGRVTFKARAHQGIEVPEFAVTYRGTDPYVRIIENNKAIYKPVMLGELRRGMFEIKKGITGGQKVIMRSSTFVAEGEEVTIEKASE